jgi:predicted nucleic acid-binding protein
VIVADTGAIVALVDADDRHHAPLRRLFEGEPDSWLLPWAILPEVDCLLGQHVGARAQERFAGDLATGAWAIEWGDPADLVRAEARLPLTAFPVARHDGPRVRPPFPGDRLLGPDRERDV